MNEIDFFPYHNRHIVFKLKNGNELSGVLTDTFNHQETKTSRTIYSFIPTRNMIAWKKAKMKKDAEKMKSLEQEIDIEDIIWAERLNY